MKSKILIGIMILMLSLAVLSGCGDDKPEEVESPDAVPAEPSESAPAEPTPAEPTPAVPDISEEELTDVETPDLDAESATEPEPAEPETVNETEDGGITDVSETGPLEDEEELTADNFRVISLKDLNAYPSEMEIKPGTTVEWRNVNDNFQHLIGWRNQKSMGVTPEPILQGQSWSYTFMEPGEIKWFSTAKPTIQGTITIKAEADEEEEPAE